MKKLFTTLTTLVLLMTALVANAQTKVEGTLENDGHKMKWSISGVTVTEQGQPKLEKVNYGGTDDGDLKQELSGTVAPGAVITADLRKVSGKDKPKIYILFDYFKEGSFFSVNGGVPIKLEEKEDMYKSFQVPSNATEVIVSIIYRTPDPHPRAYALEMKVVGRFKVGNKAPEPEPQPKPKQEEDCSCKCDKNPTPNGWGKYTDTHYRFNDFYGEVKIRPNWEEDDSYELVDLDTEIFECARIKTEEESGAILGLEDMSTYVIKPESTLLICPQEKEPPRLKMIMGCIWGNIKKMMDGKMLDSEMQECVAGILGTIFALEESSQGSKVWVFAGKVEVTNKKTGKKTELNAGQNITVKGKNNNVQSFNIEDGAKQFGIPMDHITNHYTNKPISKLSLESICKPNKGTAPKKEGNKDSGKNTTSGKKLTINKKSNTDKDTNSDNNTNVGKKPTTDKNTDKDTKAGKKPNIGKKSSTDKNATMPKGQYARYGAKCGIVMRVEDGGDIRMYYTTWWDDYGRLERSEITRCEEKVGGKWKSTTAPQIKNIIVDDKHYMYSKSTGWKQLKNDEINFLGSGSKTVDGCKLEKSGTAMVNGKLCDIFKGKRNGTTIEYYIWEGVPMKRVEKDSDGTTTTTVESIELPASIDASLFEIPKGKQ